MSWVLATLALGGAGCTGGGDAMGAAASDESGEQRGRVAYVVEIADEAGDVAESLGSDGFETPTLLRGWVTVAGLTAMPCTDVAMDHRGFAQRAWDWLVPSAHAGHGESGLPTWQVLGSQVVPLHEVGAHDHGLADEAAEPLCRVHVLLGRAEADAPSLATLPEEVTMARMTLHLELAWPGGVTRTVRTDVGWGIVADAAPTLPAGDGTARVTLRPRAALVAASQGEDLATATDKDAGRAVLRALCEGATVAYLDE
ncbi:MAG: hypothetical protein RIT45_2517 [Pseudomonadota bacterium]|jgi:hypothetical protein